MHQHNPRQPLSRIDHKVAVLENEKQHEQRINRKHKIDSQTQGIAARGVGEHEWQLVGERED